LSIDYLRKPLQIKVFKSALEKFSKHISFINENSGKAKLLINNPNKRIIKMVLSTINGFSLVDIQPINDVNIIDISKFQKHGFFL
jgi:hypothetical protein